MKRKELYSSLNSRYSLEAAFNFHLRAIPRGFLLHLATGSEGYLLTGLYDIVLVQESLLLEEEEALNSA